MTEVCLIRKAVEWTIQISADIADHLHLSEIEFRLILITGSRLLMVKESADLGPWQARISRHPIFEDMVQFDKSLHSNHSSLMGSIKILFGDESIVKPFSI